MFSFKVFLKKTALFVGGVIVLSVNHLAIASETFSQKEKAIIPVAAFAASGDIDKLKASLVQGLDAGLTINEIKEILAQMYAYAGFPRSLNALAAFMQVVQERESQGKYDVVGAKPSPFPSDRTRLQLGKENQTKLIGVEVQGALFEFSPQIDEYLKAHLFGDIFQRDVLSWKQREVATIAALANIQGVNNQLASHYYISMHNNISTSELNEFITILAQHVSAETADNAQQVLNTVLNKN